MKWIGRTAGIAAAVLFGWWLWQRVVVTDETRVKRQIAAMERAVERGDLLRLEGAIAQDYGDEWGLDKSALLGAARAFHQQYEALFIHIGDLTVAVGPDHENASAVFIAKVIAKTSGSATETEVRAERLRLFFRKSDRGWRLTRIESPELKFD